jgi:hypothetical protein
MLNPVDLLVISAAWVRRVTLYASERAAQAGVSAALVHQ